MSGFVFVILSGLFQGKIPTNTSAWVRVNAERLLIKPSSGEPLDSLALNWIGHVRE
jgi:hypothetical protein